MCTSTVAIGNCQLLICVMMKPGREAIFTSEYVMWIPSVRTIITVPRYRLTVDVSAGQFADREPAPC
jgi:hypothetical protein